MQQKTNELYITWFFVKIGISANTTSFFMILLGLIGVAMCIPHILWLNAMGIFLLMLAEVFDCVDGEIARWTKTSSVKGVYLDFVCHCLTNAPLVMICPLHLYLLNGQLRYMILAFLAYASVQCHLGLKTVYYHVIPGQISRVKIPDTADTSGSDLVLEKCSSSAGMISRFASLLYKPIDIMVIRLSSCISILLSYAGITKPLIVLSWFFTIFGIMWVIAEILYKYFFLIPNVQHSKKV